MDRAVHGLFASPPGVSTLSTVHLSNEERRREGEVCCGKVRPGRALQLGKTETAITGGGEETTNIFDTRPGGAS